MFINDLGDNLFEKPHYCADDTTTKYQLQNVNNIPSKEQNGQKEFQTDLERIEAWADAWLVSFDALKTKEVLISKACNMKVYPDFVFKGEAIARADTLRLLGGNFSLDLSWTEHLSKIRSSSPRS